MLNAFALKTNPLIIVEPDKETTYINEHSAKLEVIKSERGSRVYLLPWCGKYSTDVFEITDEDIATLVA